ncbi:MAG: methyltransferase family protein [Candidatus Dormibacteraceae bacterium]
MFFGSPDATLASVVVFWVVLFGWIGTELWLGSRRSRLPAGATDHDAGSKWFLIGCVWASIAIGIWTALLLPDAAIRSYRTEVFILGLVLMVAGMALRWYPIRVLGASFTCEVSTRPGQVVVESGPYRWVRHPSYTGGLLTVLGVLVCCVNWASLAALIVTAAGYAYRIKVEEEALAAHLGTPYREYMRRTKRLIPFVV